MKVKSSQDRSGHDRSSQVRTSLVREGVWNTKKDPKFFNPNHFGPKMFWDPKIFLDPKISLDLKCLCNPRYFGPKILWTNNFIGSKKFRTQNRKLLIGN